MTPERKKELVHLAEQLGDGPLGFTIREFLERISALEAGLRDALDEIAEAWSNVEDYPRNKHEDVELAKRLRALIGGKP